jgi:hypothetical protein
LTALGFGILAGVAFAVGFLIGMTSGKAIMQLLGFNGATPDEEFLAKLFGIASGTACGLFTTAQLGGAASNAVVALATGLRALGWAFAVAFVAGLALGVFVET